MLEILRRHNFSFSKALGQNFLVDPSVCPRIAAHIAPDCSVLEIGPGAGALTLALAPRVPRVLAVELDARLLPVLHEQLADFPQVQILHGDILNLDLAALFHTLSAETHPVSVCANLPYYITSPVLMHLLESRLPFRDITVMVQKEAADRLCAPPGTRACGAISVAVAYRARAQKLFSVPRGAFFPVPNVDSTVIQLTLHDTPPVPIPDETAFFRLVRAAFGQRRKTLINALSSGLSLEKEQVTEAVTASELPVLIRAEALTLEQFSMLAKHLYPHS